MKHFYKIIFFFILPFLSFSTSHAATGLFFSKKIDSIQVAFDKNQLILPGESFKINITSFLNNGKVKKTIGQKGGSVFWKRYHVEVIGGSFSHGRIQVNSKLCPSKGKYISIKVWPKKRKELAQTILVPLNYETKISFTPTTDFDKAPGCSFKGEITAYFNNGITRKYTNLRPAKIARNFNIFTDGVWQKKKRFIIDEDFQNIIKHKATISVVSARNPEISCNYPILLDYKHNYNLVFRGSSGMSGSDGFDGSNGSSGYDGQNGEYGENGEPGHDSPGIDVWGDAYFDSTLNCTLLYAYVENYNTGEGAAYLINPNGGKLTITSRGGDGGNGGDGGDGGNGGNGEDGRIWYETITKTRTVRKPFTEQRTKKVKKTITNEKGEQEEVEEEITEDVTVYRDVEEKYEVKIKHQAPGQDGGYGGNGGGGGFGGSGGWGGDIYLFLTNDAQKYQSCIDAQSPGGTGGMNGNRGRGGSGGHGGRGNPDGRNGESGWDGPEEIGWAPDGYDGEIIIQPIDDFYNVNKKSEETTMH